jgi:hypothetical protein
MTPLTRDDTEHGKTYYLASEVEAIAASTERLLAALDGMDRGCTEPGFRGHQNGYGEESAGDELQAAREELAALVGHVALEEVDEPEIPWLETPMPVTCI